MWQATQNVEWFNYGCGTLQASLHPDGMLARQKRPKGQASPIIIKIHGSVNWLYCENCRSLFWTPTNETYKVAGQLLSPVEWTIIDPGNPHPEDRYQCSECAAQGLGTRLATFSYLKALDFPMFQKSWFSAERILRDAKNWVFIGYSFPAADFEFKYMLKRVQLSRAEPPKFVVISGDPGAEKTYENYQLFFGRRIKKSDNFFGNGLDGAAVKYVSDLAK
jgi:hypothetical protein